MTQYKNLDTLASFNKLKSLPAFNLPSGLTADRIKDMVVGNPELYQYFYGGKPVTAEHLAVLGEMAEEAGLIAKYKEILKGSFMNTGENRMVLHHLTRGSFGDTVMHDGVDMRAFYEEQIKNILKFTDDVHSQKIKGSTGLRFKNVVQIGIGGSDLGPKAMYLALKGWAKRSGVNQLKAFFISNVDPDDAYDVLDMVNPAETLFVLVSKSGVTQETLANEMLVREVLRQKGLDDNKHFVAVTSKTSPLANNPRYLASFYMDDFIGGRYSSTSAVGLTILSLSFGRMAIGQFLNGAHEGDKMALETSIQKNPALLDALLGVYERNILGYPSTAVLPYSQALSRFSAHLQQLDMESNGKSVNRSGEPLGYPTGALIFGEPGTNGQHSFFQLLHQGTDIIPLQFIGFNKNQMIPNGTPDVGSTYLSTDCISQEQNKDSQDKLKANLIAQIVAFTKGHKDTQNPNKNFKGERPSSLLWAEALNPFTMGALLAHFENKVMFQGFLWNVNSFDQEGVQLGKVLTDKVLKKDADRDEALKALETIVSL